MSISDELREFASHCVGGMGGDSLRHIADLIDAEYQKILRELNNLADNSMLLPVDANGEIIHVGDMVWTTRFGVVEVEGFIHNAIAFNVYDPQPARICTVPADQCRHYHTPTVEDVLREFAEKVTDSQIPDVRPTYEEAIAEYAAKLRLADDRKEQ